MSINWDNTKATNSPFYAEEYNNLRDHSDEKTASYIIRKESGCYEAIKGGTATDAGKIIYGGATNEGGVDGTNASAVIQAVIDACADGDLIFVRKAIYTLDTMIQIEKSLRFIGEGVSNDTPSSLPDGPPVNNLTGTVFRITHANDAFYIKDNIYNFHMAHFGIQFTEEVTGAGICCKSSVANWGLTYGIFEDISVLNNSGGSFAFYFGNTQHLHCRNLRSWGGPFICCWNDTADTNYGNSVFDECYTYTDRTVTAAAVVYINMNAGNTWGLTSFRRLQMNSKSESNAVLKMVTARMITFVDLDIETNHQFAILGENSKNIVFINPYVWDEHATGYIKFDADCQDITFLGGHFNIVNIQMLCEKNAFICPELVVPPNLLDLTTILEVRNQCIRIPNRIADPATGGWGASQKGMMWFNTTTNVVKYWDGTAVKTVTAS